MNLRAVVIPVGFALLTVALSAQGPRRDGRWEVTQQMDMPGMPMKMPATTMTQCITKEEAADPAKAVPKGDGGRGGDQGNCKVTDFKTEGPKATWKMQCEGRDAMTGDGEIVYGTDAYTGSIRMLRAGQTLTLKLSGKRLGDCTK